MARPKGLPNKRTKEICELIDGSKLGLIEAMIAVLNNDWKTLGLDDAKKTQWTSSGIEYEVDAITLDQRIEIMKTLIKYRYSQKQSVEVSTGDTGIKIVIEDYTGKK